jgi:hypothetical protein
MTGARHAGSMNKPPAAPATPNSSPDDVRQPAAGKGMPEKQPQPQRPLAGRHETQQDRSDDASLELPHERDQASDMTAAELDPKVAQAAKDVASGRSDTSKANETDQTYKKLRD